MSYKALYRTHRPTTFDQVVGQDHITSTLKNIILKDRVSHAYLFAGPRGTGKTSVAHLFARTLNCSDLVDPTIACGQCEQCQTKNSMDIVEIDAASNNGVADIRTLIENAKYAPSISKYKVYIIDEVHMLSKGAFNALLKTLEEPPKHVVFILATTEPHKIPVTILSRTQRFNFRRIADDVIQKQLKNVLDKESIQYDEESIRMIAKLSNGGMRDALSIADQASAFSNGVISFQAISQVFGIVSTSNQMRLIRLAYTKQAKDLLTLATEFIDNGGDIERMTTSLIDILKDFIVYAKTSDKSLLGLLNNEEAESFGITVTFAYGAIDALMKLLSDLRLSEVPRQAFELTLLKITELGDAAAVIEQPLPKQHTPITQIVSTPQPVVEVKQEPELLKEEPVAIKEEPIVIKEEPVVVEEIEIADPVIQVETIAKPAVVDQEKTLMQEIVEEKSVEDLMDVFSTQELTQKDEEIFTADKLESLQKEIEATREFEIPQQIIDDQEETVEMANIEDDILSTQEIPVNEIPKAETTQEINVMELFSLDGEDLSKPAPAVHDVDFTVDEIMNLLVQADRSQLTNVKQSWSGALSFSSNPKYGTFANLLDAAKIISAGPGFVLVSSNESLVISQINSYRKDKDFVEFINILLGAPRLLFAITKDQFNVVKETWGRLSKNNELPKPTPVEKLEVEEKQLNEAEGFGTSIFGDLFSS